MQNNWKNRVKNTFEDRKIIPTQEFWNQLENQLDSHYVKKKKQKFMYYIAASFMVSLLSMAIFCNKGFFDEDTQAEEYAIANKNSESLKNNATKDFQLHKTQKDSFKTEYTNSITSEKHYQINNVDFVTRKEPFKDDKSKKILKDEISSSSKTYVDEVLGDFSADKIFLALQEESIFEQRVDSIFQAMYFTNITPDELLLVASSEAKLNKYIEENLDAEKILSDIEKSYFRYKVRLFFDKVNDEYDKLKIALHSMKRDD
ncbi:hypothetical protein CAPN010_10500 [Capnocytophaga cynodegmi]|uniref:hypothetical protein n=1 Tax=Capnocytophaga cynodegmi TaxID=28189 RepID=UPI001EE291C7|nr:hypothetical protein [Capnocytophaga cynodegmi]GJQ06892.1 hypothetical protein CAPN010_10500 [Capnocytophaga cynodegmi]